MADTQDRPLVEPNVSVEDFVAAARGWLEANLAKRTDRGGDFVWGDGEFGVDIST